MSGTSAHKEQFDALLDLSKLHRERLERRRSYEWKVNLALWAGLGALAGVLATKEVNLDEWRCWVPWFAGGILVLIGAVFTFVWIRTLCTQNNQDSRLAESFAREAEALACSGVTSLKEVYRRCGLDDRVVESGEEANGDNAMLRRTPWIANWAAFSEIIFTWCMICLVGLAAFGRCAAGGSRSTRETTSSDIRLDASSMIGKHSTENSDGRSIGND
jgi:hypothetical protein